MALKMAKTGKCGIIAAGIISCARGKHLLENSLNWVKSAHPLQKGSPFWFQSASSVSPYYAFCTSSRPVDFNNGKELLDLDSDGKAVTVMWNDGKKSRFHSIWLRHNCHCHDCRQEHSGQKTIAPSTVPYSVSVTNIQTKGENLDIHFEGDNHHHVGRVPLSFLKNHCYEAPSLKSKQDAVKLGPPVTVAPKMCYSDLIKSDKEKLRWLKQINEAGFSVVTGVPTENNMVHKVGEIVGPIDDLIYGKLFDVVSNPKPINIAYSEVNLGFHMDLIYYESPPGLQLLHCMRFDECVTGGESILLDVFHVAEEFRSSHPEEFKTLVQVPATFQKIHYDRGFPVEMTYQRPHIVLNPQQEIVCINWAPPFEGPLAVEQDKVETYYKAYEAFAKAIEHSPHIVEFRMKPGDLLIFNNRRILHGRRSFKSNGGYRHLQGCYINIDHFKNQVQVYSRLHGSGQPAKRVGNQDWF